jgi:hypothetical protein
MAYCPKRQTLRGRSIAGVRHFSIGGMPHRQRAPERLGRELINALMDVLPEPLWVR